MAVPPSVTFKRNYAGRVHSAQHSMNNSTGKSTSMLCGKVGAQIPDNSHVGHTLKLMDTEIEYHREATKKNQAHKEMRRRGIKTCTGKMTLRKMQMAITKMVPWKMYCCHSTLLPIQALPLF